MNLSERITWIGHLKYARLSVLAFLIFILLLVVFSKPSAPTGDGVEYILTTEALFNHQSFDIRAEDSKSYKKQATLKQEWNSVPRHQVFDSLEKFFAQRQSLEYLDVCAASYYVNKEHKIYVHHFVFYSLLNLPMRYVMQLTNNEPLIGFDLTNVLFITLTCILLLFYTKDSFWHALAITLIFFFNGMFWYIKWTHTEVLTCCLVTASLFLFFNKRLYLSVFLMALASLQNQPLAILVFFMVLYTIFANRFTIKSFLLSGLCSWIVLLPSLFYYYLFGITNLVSHGGYLDKHNVTIDRVIGFFVDLDQGAILAIPLILPAYLILLLFFTIKSIRERNIEWSLFIPIAILFISCLVSMMTNWVHGMAVINRYAIWISAIISVHFYFLLLKTEIKEAIRSIILAAVIFFQITFILYFHFTGLSESESLLHKSHTKWVLNNFPSLYNPDPCIFIHRTLHKPIQVTDSTLSPVLYLGNTTNKKIKIAVHRSQLDSLKQFGLSSEEIEDIESNNKFILNWTYLHENSFHDLDQFSQEKNRIIKNQLLSIENRIKSDSLWMQAIRKKSLDQNIPVDSVIKIDAEYVYNVMQ